MKHIGNGAGDMTCETSCFNTWPTFIVRLGHSQPEKLSNFKQIPLLQFPCDRGGMSCHMRSLPSIYSKTGDHVFKWSSNHSSRENWKLIHDQSVNRREAATFWVRCLCPAYGNKAGYKGKFMAWHRDLPWSLTRSEWNLGPWACQRTTRFFCIPKNNPRCTGNCRRSRIDREDLALQRNVTEYREAPTIFYRKRFKLPWT